VSNIYEILSECCPRLGIDIGPGTMMEDAMRTSAAAAADREDRSGFMVTSANSSYFTGWSDSKDRSRRPFLGYYETYSKGGYSADLVESDYRSVATLLRRGGWLSRATRVVFVDASFYNGENSHFLTCGGFVEKPHRSE